LQPSKPKRIYIYEDDVNFMREWDWPKIIAAYEIIGGAIGAILVIFVFISSSLLSPLLAAIYLPFLILFLFTTYAGLLLWRRDARGINLSILSQIFQILQIKVVNQS
jgi:VIT1/CCC1 family predicted Fe2+/Mn2+ transporter